jgi:hypothetical protein
MIAEHIARGQLHRDSNAPLIEHQVYAVWTTVSDRQPLLQPALRFIPSPVEVRARARATTA